MTAIPLAHRIPGDAFNAFDEQNPRRYYPVTPVTLSLAYIYNPLRILKTDLEEDRGSETACHGGRRSDRLQRSSRPGLITLKRWDRWETFNEPVEWPSS